ncbi:MAG: type II toxin-antitoxin system RatA family toxin [Myxococcota bacterium]
MAGTEQEVRIAVSPEDFFTVIADYASYPEFLSEMEEATVLSRGNGVADVRFTVNLIKRVTYTLTLVENPPLLMEWSLKEGPFKVSDGRWKLERLPNGHTLARYQVEVKVAAFVPKSISSRMVGKTVPALLASFKARAEGLYPAP